jgi:hypothetical protein
MSDGRAILFHATPVAALMLGLYYYWFAVVDRYVVFLYGHLGAEPFDATTTSRYLMAGAVAGGCVLVGYTVAANLLALVAQWRGRVYAPPPWWKVWRACALPLALGIPLITAMGNEPPLPDVLAVACALTALVGLALALPAAAWAAERPVALLLLAGDGLGLLPVLLLMHAVELPARNVISPEVAYGAALFSLLGGVVWLLAMTALRAAVGSPHPRAGRVLLAGLCMAYLGLPLVHHLLFTPAEYRYISASANFLAYSPVLQVAVLATATLLALFSQICSDARLFAPRRAGQPGQAIAHGAMLQEPLEELPMAVFWPLPSAPASTGSAQPMAGNPAPVADCGAPPDLEAPDAPVAEAGSQTSDDETPAPPADVDEGAPEPEPVASLDSPADEAPPDMAQPAEPEQAMSGDAYPAEPEQAPAEPRQAPAPQERAPASLSANARRRRQPASGAGPQRRSASSGRQPAHAASHRAPIRHLSSRVRRRLHRALPRGGAKR